jgi:hypothetical protein
MSHPERHWKVSAVSESQKKERAGKNYRAIQPHTQQPKCATRTTPCMSQSTGILDLTFRKIDISRLSSVSASKKSKMDEGKKSTSLLRKGGSRENLIADAAHAILGYEESQLIDQLDECLARRFPDAFESKKHAPGPGEGTCLPSERES